MGKNRGDGELTTLRSPFHRSSRSSIWGLFRSSFFRSSFYYAAILALTGLLTACGTTTTLGGQPAATTPTIATTTTTTIPPTTTTTIDFSRPVDQGDGRLPEEATIDDVAELVEDMRGQTDSVYQQLSRLVDFPKLASPIGSQILDFSLTIQPVEDGYLNQSTVELRAPAEPNGLVSYFDAELESRGWNMADVMSEPTEDGTLTSLVFRVPGTSGEDEELTVVLDQRPGVVMVDLGHHTKTGEDDERFALLHAWQDAVRVPSSAEVTETAVSTADNVATVTVVHRLEAETAAEAREDIIDLVRDDEFQTDAIPEETAENDDSPVTLTEVENGQEFTLSFSETGEDEAIDMTVSTTFALTSID